jgi:hypothetical protein
MNDARRALMAVWFAASIYAGASGAQVLAADHPSSAGQVGGGYGLKHMKSGSRGALPNRLADRSFPKAASRPLWSGGHNLAVIGGPYRANRNVAVWGEPLRGTRSAAAISGNPKNSGRY